MIILTAISSCDFIAVEGKKYEDRACCESYGIVPSKSCPSNKLSDGAIRGVIIGSALVVSVFLVWVLLKLGTSFFYKKMSQVSKAMKKHQKQSKAGANSKVKWGVSHEGMLR